MSVPSLTSAASYDVNKISVYHLSPGKMLVMYLILAVGVIFGWIFIGVPLSSQNPRWASEYEVSVPTGFIIFDIFAGIFLASLTARVVTSPWGIEYYSILDGIKLRAPWKSVVGVEYLQYFYKQVEFLVTSEPAEKSGLLVASIAMFKSRHPGARDMDADKIRRSIPVGNFTSDWRYSKLGEEIRRYAPQAFGKESERESASQTATEGTRGATSYEGAIAFPTARLKGEKRMRLWSMVIALAVIVIEVIFSFFVAPSIYRSVHPMYSSRSAQPVDSRSAQPLLSAANPLPGQLFMKDAEEPRQ